MNIEELNRKFKASVEKIPGVKIFGSEPLSDSAVRERHDYAFRIEWTDGNENWPIQIDEKKAQLLRAFSEVGVSNDMLSHLTCRVGKGCIWPTFFGGIKHNAVKQLLSA